MIIIIIRRGILKSSLYLSSRPLVFLRVAANVYIYIYICTRVYSCSIQWFMVFNHLFHNCDPFLFLPWTYECFSSFIWVFFFNDLSLFDALYAICICVYIRVFFFHRRRRRLLLHLSMWLNMSEGHISTVCPIITFCWSSYCSKEEEEIKLETPSCDTTLSSKTMWRERERL